MVRTRHFEVDADAPVRGAFWAVNVEVPKPDFAHALGDNASLFFTRDAGFLSAVRGVEAIDEVEVFVAKRSGWV